MKSCKQIVCLIVICLGLNTTALASGAIPPAKPYFDGAYIGIAGALGLTKPQLSSDNKIDVWTDSTKTTKLVEINGHHGHGSYSKYSFGVPIFAGYGKTFGRYYVGGELGASYFVNSKMHDSYTYSVTPMNPGATHDPRGKFEVRNPVSLNAVLRLGYSFPDRFMLYALVGLDYSQFKVTNTMSDHYVDADIDHNFTITDKFNKWLPAIMTGIGGEMAINDHLSLRLQYTFAFYDSYEHKAMQQGTFYNKLHRKLPYDINMKTKINPNRGTLQLMLSYLFN
jgi:opacity protein-like surface antigen